jgi:hypothetical protein
VGAMPLNRGWLDGNGLARGVGFVEGRAWDGTRWRAEEGSSGAFLTSLPHSSPGHPKESGLKARGPHPQDRAYPP